MCSGIKQKKKIRREDRDRSGYTGVEEKKQQKKKKEKKKEKEKKKRMDERKEK